MTFVVNKPAKFGHAFSATYCTYTNYTRYFKFALVYKCCFPFAVLRLEKFKVQKCLSRRIRAILRQKLRQERSLSSWNGFNIGAKPRKRYKRWCRQISWYIHNSHFKIHDHTRSHAINFQSIFATKTVWLFVVWHFPFQFAYYGKQGLDTFDDGYVDGIYLMMLNQDVCGKKIAVFCEHTLGLYFYRVQRKRGSVLYFSQDKHKLAHI